MENDAGAVCDSRIANRMKLGGGALEDTFDGGTDGHVCGLPMALTAEKLAEQYGITRRRGCYALRSSSWLMRRTRLAGFVKSLCRWNEAGEEGDCGERRRSPAAGNDDEILESCHRV